VIKLIVIFYSFSKFYFLVIPLFSVLTG